ncbi:MAG: EamA family transporter [Chloroflexota bacterium]|nr:MAG: EamA family transporter [Chloroflexota bacterium]
MTTEQCLVIPEDVIDVQAAPGAESMSTSPGKASTLPDTKTLVAFGFFILFAGGASVAVRITYGELPPFYGGAARFALAGLVLWLLMFIRKIPFPRGQALLGAALFGLLSVGLAFTFIAWGLVETPASTYQVLMALVPLLTIFFAYFHGIERIRWQGLLGSLLAVGGIAVVVGGASGEGLSLPHILAIIVGGACLAEAGVIAKKFPRSHPIATNAIAMTIGSLLLGTISLLANESWVLPKQVDTWLAFGYLVVFVTIILFLLYLYVLGRWTASGTSYGFVITPLITIVIASLLAGEQITYSFIGGAVLVLAGVLVGALLPSKPPQPPEKAQAGTGAPAASGEGAD